MQRWGLTLLCHESPWKKEGVRKKAREKRREDSLYNKGNEK